MASIILSFVKLTLNCIIPTFKILQELMMNNYDQGKKVRRIAAVVYILIMAVVVGGTYLSQQQKAAADKASQNSPSH
jgi:hypothetical protein